MHITKISFKFILALHSAISNFTNFITIEAFPSFTIEAFKEIYDKYTVNKVYERVAHVTLILKVNWQVEEIILTSLLSIERFQ